MNRRCFLVLLLGFTLPWAARAAERESVDAIVSADGRGDFRSVQAAIASAQAVGKRPYRILVRPGRYEEHVVVVGQGLQLRGEPGAAERTVISLGTNLASQDAATGKRLATPDSATVLIRGDDFRAEDITFENTTPREARVQGLAVYCTADRAVFRRCRFLGWQDTLRVDSPRADGAEPDVSRPEGLARQYFADCYIEGHVDFIYAAGLAVFERCHIHAKADGWITAPCTPEDAPYGFVFFDCRVTTAEGLRNVYLGRPWRIHAKSLFVRTRLAEGIHPKGWDNWDKPAAEVSARFVELASTGPGANGSERVPWARTESSDAGAPDIGALLAGRDAWNPRF